MQNIFGEKLVEFLRKMTGGKSLEELERDEASSRDSGSLNESWIDQRALEAKQLLDLLEQQAGEASPGKDITNLNDIWVSNGTTRDKDGSFRGFVTLRAEHSGGVALGQLDPGELRDMALKFLSAAEAADQDTLVISLLVSRGLPLESVASLISDMREKREKLGGES